MTSRPRPRQEGEGGARPYDRSSKVRPLRSPTHSLRSQWSIPNDGRMCDGQHTSQAYVRLKLGGDQGKARAQTDYREAVAPISPHHSLPYFRTLDSTCIMASSSFSTWVRQRSVCERASGSLLTARAGRGSETLQRSNPPLKGHAIPTRDSAHLWEKTYPVFAHELPI